MDFQSDEQEQLTIYYVTCTYEKGVPIAGCPVCDLLRIHEVEKSTILRREVGYQRSSTP
jgi:hypothetical protein